MKKSANGSTGIGEDEMADRMWSEGDFDFVEIDGNVTKFRHVEAVEEELSPEELKKVFIVDLILWTFLFVAILFIIYVIYSSFMQVAK